MHERTDSQWRRTTTLVSALLRCLFTRVKPRSSEKEKLWMIFFVINTSLLSNFFTMLCAVRTVEWFEAFCWKESIYFIYKYNSNSCPISQRTLDAIGDLTLNDVPVPIYYLDVIPSKPLSNHISNHFGIRHESPQIIAVVNNEAVSHASHMRINEERLKTTYTTVMQPLLWS